LKITFKDEGAGKVGCEGTVPTKVHACAVFLTCMSVHGVGMVDLAKLRIEHWGSETTPSQPGAKPDAKPAPDGRGGAEKAAPPSRLGLYAIVLDPDDKGVTTKPAGAKAFRQTDIIVVGDVPASVIDKDRGLHEYPSGNPGNQVPDKGTQTPAESQPVAPHNPGAYPDNPK
jgi:hypothetical protein